MSDKKKLKVMLLLGLPVLGFIAWFIGYMAYKGHMFWEEAEFQRVQEEQKIKESTMFPESILKSDQQEVRNKNKWSKGYMYNRRALPINYPVMIMSSPTTSPTEITSLSTVSSVKVPVMRISVPFTS
ncbi:hypothetical protein N7462_009716 [Penicillium macrosclerotiorum]|uniref:uncharacterized protein n=1 Tax=Penicillium macrosclerotiorum TaxID=303699 RepID=UPI00254813AF|nr:uncharacterized protein N7462_009716 [Penicillium macrosclerotiorum]KAJ5668646.1 hypothetical protein N7462_009716 [Penicillium macrosclerotiorum]